MLDGARLVVLFRVVLTIGGMLTTSLVWRQGRALLFEEFSLQEGVECFLDDSAVFRGSAETLMRVPGSLASIDPD